MCLVQGQAYTITQGLACWFAPDFCLLSVNARGKPTEGSLSVLFVVKGQGMDLAFAYKGPIRSCLCLVHGLCLVTLASNLQANQAKRDASARLWLVLLA